MPTRSTEAEKRLAEHGPNALAPPERPSFLRKLWAQINSALIWILLAAVIISGGSGIEEIGDWIHGRPSRWRELVSAAFARWRPPPSQALRKTGPS